MTNSKRQRTTRGARSLRQGQGQGQGQGDGPLAGIGVDYYGGQVYDPTQNVRELVEAESKYQDAMRETVKDDFKSALSFIRDQIKLIADGADRFQNAQRDAETKRIDQLAQNRQEFQNTIRDMLAESVRTTSTLVSTQLVQIQATFDTRVSKLEAYQFTQAGKASVADPQIADTMSAMARSITSFQTSTTDAMQKSSIATAEAMAKLTLALSSIQVTEGRVGGNVMGREQSNARLLAVVGTISTVVAVIITAIMMIVALRGHA